MSFTSFNSIIPSLRINFLSDQPLSIDMTERGIVVLPLKISTGTKGEIYTVNQEVNETKDKSLAEKEQLLLDLALDYSKTVLVYNLTGAEAKKGKEERSASPVDIDSMLTALTKIEFNTLCYPYEDDGADDKIVAWIKKQRDEEAPIQAVLSTTTAPDHEGIINVQQGLIIMNNGEPTTLTKKETTVIVAGMTAGANIHSLTNRTVMRAIDVEPHLSKTEQENHVKAGKFIFSARSQTVKVLVDINSLTTYENKKAPFFSKNRTIRLFDNITKDIITVFDSNVKGILNNNKEGRNLFKSMLVEYFRNLEKISAIQNFNPDDITVMEVIGNKDSLEVAVNIQVVDSIEKVYMNVYLS